MAGCLEAALSSLEALEGIISRSFGPNGQDIVLKTETGCIIVTNSGQTILDSLALSHQTGRLILQMVSNHVKVTGDNSKMFIMILIELLRNVSQDTLMRSQARSVTSKLAGLSNACGILGSNTTNENLSSVLRPYCSKIVACSSSELDRCVRGLANTALRGKFSPQVVKVLTEQISEVLKSIYSKSSDLLFCLQYLIEEFSDVCIQAHGISMQNSTVKEGFIFQREPSGRCDEQFLSGRKKFLCLNCGFDFEKIEFGRVQFSFDLQNTQTYTWTRVQILSRMSRKLQDLGIRILLCTSSLPDYALSILNKNFCVLQNVEERDQERICTFFKILPVESLEEIIQDDLSLHIGTLSKAESMIIGTQKFFRIVPEKEFQSSKPHFQLILCAPSSGICQQYEKEILNALKAIKMSFFECYGQHKIDKDGMVSLPGAGASEALLASHFEGVSFKAGDEDLKLVAKSLSQAMMSIPRALHSNSNQTGVSRFIDVENDLRRLLDDRGIAHGNDLYGIDGDSGALINPTEFDIIEPFSSKVLLVGHVLQAAQQIFKIDQIIPSKIKQSDQ